ncbi:cytochrome b5 domain-containing protein [Pseudothermotoga sp. U03pept]|uniref:cytochrome b5 domain-containing protein n=1 Tax=Pseudothermotoga sp. U03pept TaxID=3447012 RepID=UPI003F122B48
MTRISFLVILSLFAIAIFGLDLASFDLNSFKGEFPLISLQKLLQTDEFVSVDGVVYRISAPKKFLTSKEVDQKLLVEQNFVGVLAITIDELATFTGKDKPALVAANGVVYDVSASKQWSGGKHRNLHNAGEELTYELLKDSPHGVRKLGNVKPYGVLVFTPEQLAKYNGRSGAKSYASVFGVVYDMSYSKRVSNGVHYNYPMGNELTFEILQMPNHTTMLSRVYAIGLLVFTEDSLVKFDGKTFKTFGKDLFKAFIKVGSIVYDVTDKPDWREKLNLEESALPGRDYTFQFECELEGSCTHDHPDSDVLKSFDIVGFELVK